MNPFLTGWLDFVVFSRTEFFLSERRVASLWRFAGDAWICRRMWNGTVTLTLVKAAFLYPYPNGSHKRRGRIWSKYGRCRRCVPLDKMRCFVWFRGLCFRTLEELLWPEERSESSLFPPWHPTASSIVSSTPVSRVICHYIHPTARQITGQNLQIRFLQLRNTCVDNSLLLSLFFTLSLA